MRLGHVVRGFLVLSAGHVVGKLLALAASVLMARSIGPGPLGVFATTITIFGYILIISNWGTDAIGIRRIAMAPDQVRRTSKSVMCVRLLFGIPGTAIALTAFAIAGWDVRVAIPLALAVPVYAFRADWALLALGRPISVSLSAVIREGAFLASLALLLPRAPAAAVAAWCYLIADATWALSSQVFTSFQSIRTSRGARPDLLLFIRDGWPMVVTAAMSLTFTKFDTPLLALLRSTDEAGVYWAAYTVIFAVMGFSAMLSRSALPEMARSVASRDATPNSKLTLLLLSTMAAGGLAAVVLFGMAEEIMLRLYGRQFIGGAAPLRLLSLCLPLSFTSGILLNRLVAEGRQRSLAVGASAAALVNVVLNLVLIPLRGMEGAAVATLVSEATLLSVGLLGLGWNHFAAATSIQGGWILLSVFATILILPRIVNQQGLALALTMGCVFCTLACPPVVRAWRARPR